jgi:PAS domain S-box-containing protein
LRRRSNEAGSEAAGGAGTKWDFGRRFWRTRTRTVRDLPAPGPDVSDEEFRLLADNLPTLCWIANREGEVIWLNRRWHEYCGTTQDQMTGWGWQAVHDPDLLPEVLQRWKQSIATGEPFEMTLGLRGADGILRPFITRAQPILDPAGEVARWYGVNTEISAQMEAEKALREERDLSRALLQTMTDGFVLLDRNYVIREINAESLRIERRTREDFIGKTHWEAWPGTEGGEFHRLYARVIEHGETVAKQHFFTFPEGHSGWLDMRAYPAPDGGVAIIYRDITAQKQAEEELRETTRRLDAILDNTRMAVFMMDERQYCVYANAAAEQLTGYSFDELRARPLHDVIHNKYPDGRPYPIEECPIDSALPEENQVQGEELFVHKDGSFYPVAFTASPIRDDAGRPIGTVIELRDISEERARDAALLESEARFRTIFEQANDYIITADLDQVITSCNPAVAEAIGYASEEIVGHPIREFLDPDQFEQTTAMLHKKLRDGGTTRHTVSVNARDGRRLIWEINSQLTRDEEGRPTGLHAIGRDVTEQRATEEALREETRRLQTLNRTGAAVAGELDLERLVQSVTDAGVDLSGAQFGAFFYNVVDAAGERYTLYTISGVDRAEFDKFPMPRNTGVFAPTFEGRGVVRSNDITADPRYGRNAPYNGMPEGHLPVRSYLAVPVISRTGEVIGGLFFGHEEPGRFTKEHEELLLGVVAQAAVAIDNARLFDATQREIAERRLAEEALLEFNRSLEERVAAAIGEREKAEEALRQSQKMETLGQLTGGVAHDFNNLLQVVTGNLDILQRHLPEDAARLRRAADNARKGADRAATLTQRLLAFARRQPLTPMQADINRLVGSMSDLLHRTLGETVEIEIVLAPRLWRVEVDPNQLENALLNLAVNARDAMPAGGKLTIETSNTYLDSDYAAAHPEVTAGQYVLLCVSDTGQGMDQATVDRAIEPFFTTKEVGRGTGLGLSMVYGFIKQSGGHFRIYSEPGEGTTVRIYLPRLLGPIEEEAAAAPKGALVATRGETILVCEDDEDVRAYSVEVLRELGYAVLEAADGPAALRQLEEKGAEVDLLFTDVVLPGGMTGAVLAERARLLRPHLKVLFTTGYARNAIVHQGRLDEGVELLTKPFTHGDLASRIRDLLDRH